MLKTTEMADKIVAFVQLEEKREEGLRGSIKRHTGLSKAIITYVSKHRYL